MKFLSEFCFFLLFNFGDAHKLSKFYQNGWSKLIIVTSDTSSDFSGCLLKNEIRNRQSRMIIIRTVAQTFTISFAIKLHSQCNIWEAAICNCKTGFKENCQWVIHPFKLYMYFFQNIWRIWVFNQCCPLMPNYSLTYSVLSIHSIQSLDSRILNIISLMTE